MRKEPRSLSPPPPLPSHLFFSPAELSEVSKVTSQPFFSFLSSADGLGGCRVGWCKRRKRKSFSLLPPPPFFSLSSLPILASRVRSRIRGEELRREKPPSLFLPPFSPLFCKVGHSRQGKGGKKGMRPLFPFPLSLFSHRPLPAERPKSEVG